MPAYSPERWAALTELLGEALDRPEPERLAFLDVRCGGDAALRGEVEQLLASYREAETQARFERGAADLVPLAFPEATPDESVGPYRLLREIGRGGMGRVWLAERSDGVFEQRVAVKMLHAGVVPEAHPRRFEAERRILARLDHPNIARILDGGLTADGRPYLVMEYVEGEPITTWCANRRPGLDETLALFRTVCDAVAYAHRNLVVHRDLKPGNVFVTADGTVKLLDFGIAKLLDADETAVLPETRTGMAMMTPEYAAPEQVTSAAITTATDVYALGVVLFELLSGARPYAFASRAPTAIERVVCHTQPARPSATVEDRARARRLRGDLDTIVLKALRKEPERRYASAAELGEDLRRYAERLPVLARPDTARYRLATFARRHRLGVAAGGAVSVAVLVALAVSLVQVRIATQERARAEAVNLFLHEMLASPDPYADGPEVRVVDVLDRAGEALAVRFAAQPETEAALRLTLGTSYLELGLFEPAEVQLQRVLALAERRPGGDLLTDAQAALGDLFHRTGAYGAADSLLTRALARDRRRHGASHARVADRLGALGALRWAQGEYETAEPLLRESLRLHERHADSTALAPALGRLATLRADQGHFEEAEALYRRELALLRAAHGERHPAVAQALSHLAIIRDDLEDFQTARALHQEALAIFRAVRGPMHPDVAYAMANLATVEIKLGNLARADSLQQESIAINAASLGETHPTVGIQYNNLGSLRRRQGDDEGALAAFERAVAIWRESLPPEHPYLAYGLQNAATLLVSMDRLPEALARYREAYAIRLATMDADHPDRANTASLYGEALARAGRRAEAEPLLVQAHATLLAALGPDHSATRQAAERLATYGPGTGP